MNKLSFIANALQGQKMFQVLARAKKLEQQGIDIIHLEIGDPDFSSPPNVVESACTALRDGHTHYAISAGLEEFREAAAKMTESSRGFLPDINQILVTPGGNLQIDLEIACTVNPGEEVIITDPCFVSYKSIIELCGAIAITVPLSEVNEFRLDPDDLREVITDKTRMIIINSPHNHTGSLMSEEEVKEIYQIVEDENLYLMSDEVYGRMVYPDSEKKFFSPSVYDQCKKRTFIIHSFSKSYAMTGWRIGAITGPKNVVEKMALLLETITSCVSPFIQIAAIEAMTGSQEYVTDMIQSYRRRRDIIVDGLNEIRGITCLKPGGAFYVFPNITGTGLTSEEFSTFILDKVGVATCPGNYFGSAGEGYVRFCYANSEENIIEAIKRIKGLLN
jgi:aspartate aminotransferase